MHINETEVRKHIKLAIEKEASGDYEGAIVACRKVIKEKDDIAEIYYILGSAYSKIGYSEKAMEAYENAINFNPSYTQAFINIGVLSYNENKYQDAALAFKRATEIDPSNPKAHFNLGNTYFEQKLFIEALNEYRLATKIENRYAKGYYCAALCCLNLGDTEGAMSELVLLSNVDQEMASDLTKMIFSGQ